MTRDASKQERCAPRGFTLIELLVVVSIICLLMSVLVPSVTRAQKQGEQIHCLANQHQLFLAWMLHITNNDDQLCPPEIYNVSLKSYLPIEDVFFCKTAESGSARTPVRHSSSYGISNTMGGSPCDGVQSYLRFHKISHPGECMVFADRQVNMSLSYWPLLRDHAQKRWLWREPNLLGVGGMTARHANGCNMTFADGHGEKILWKDPRTLGLIKGTVADEIEVSIDNPDLDYLVRILVGNRPVEDETEEGESTDGI